MFRLNDHRLREIEGSDSPLLFRWRNSDHIRVTSFNDCLMTPEQHHEWFESLGDNRRSKTLVFESLRVPIGLVTFNNIEKRHSTAYWGFYLGEPNLPEGTGGVLTYFGLEYAFVELQIRKVNAEILASNLKSIRLHQRLGFTKEGHFHEHVSKGGTYHDVLICALFARDWREQFRSAIGTALFVDYASGRECDVPRASRRQ